MFEALETGKFLGGDEFDAREGPLREQLLQAQLALAKTRTPVVVVIAGADGAGKGALAHRLNAWMDPRGIETNAMWSHSDEEESRPYFWRYWRKLPPGGEIGIFLGSWYSRMLRSVLEDDPEATGPGPARLRQINDFERLLTNGGYRLVKLWLHISRDMQRLQLAEEAPRKQQNPRVDADVDAWWRAYPDFLDCAEQVILRTDTANAPWHLIEAEDRNYREITAGDILKRALQDALRTHPERRADATLDVSPPAPPQQPTVLDKVDLGATLAKDEYKTRLQAQQARLQDLAWQAHRQAKSLVAVFEGWDAAGKGSAIRRVTAAIDPRLYHLVQFAAPTDEEQRHHYLWRFWRRLERDGRATFFDRSWYGRVLVERVEGLAAPAAWRRAYDEINQFERQLAEHGSVVAKFWLHISPQEQLARFREREEKTHKQHKITPEDWRNRERWRDYEFAVEDMVAHTSTSHAPWTLVAGNDKRFARVQILETLCDRLEATLAP